MRSGSGPKLFTVRHIGSDVMLMRDTAGVFSEHAIDAGFRHHTDTEHLTGPGRTLPVKPLFQNLSMPLLMRVSAGLVLESPVLMRLSGGPVLMRVTAPWVGCNPLLVRVSRVLIYREIIGSIWHHSDMSDRTCRPVNPEKISDSIADNSDR